MKKDVFIKELRSLKSVIAKLGESVSPENKKDYEFYKLLPDEAIALVNKNAMADAREMLGFIQGALFGLGVMPPRICGNVFEPKGVPKTPKKGKK